MTRDLVKESIRTFLHRHLRGIRIRDSDDIFVMGLVNSMFAIQLVQFTEKQFGVEIGPDDLQLENFRTVDAIASLVERKASAGAAERV